MSSRRAMAVTDTFSPMLRRVEKEILSGLRGRRNEVGKMLIRWGEIYREFAQRRYQRNSGGGGEWAPLSSYTILVKMGRLGRKKPKGKRGRERREKRKNTAMKNASLILIRKRIMLRALNKKYTGRPGAYQRMTGRGIEVGYGGSARYKYGSRARIASVAGFHQRGGIVGGGFRLPKREVIVLPKGRTLARIAVVSGVALENTFRKSV